MSEHLVGVDMEKLPRVVDPWGRVGGITCEAARACGLLEGTPVFTGAGEQPAGFLGAGLTEPGSLIDVSGSSTILSRCVDEFRPDLVHRAVMYMPSVLRGRISTPSGRSPRRRKPSRPAPAGPIHTLLRREAVPLRRALPRGLARAQLGAPEGAPLQVQARVARQRLRDRPPVYR